MEINEIISQLKDKFGNSVNVEQITEKLNGFDHSKMSFTEIVAKLKDGNILGDLDGDGKVESTIDELKGKPHRCSAAFLANDPETKKTEFRKNDYPQ